MSKLKLVIGLVLLIFLLLRWTTTRVLGMDFIDQVKAITLPFANSMCILEGNNTCTISLTRGKTSTSTLLALQFSKGVKRLKPTYLVALKQNDGLLTPGPPTAVKDILEDSSRVV